MTPSTRDPRDPQYQRYLRAVAGAQRVLQERQVVENLESGQTVQLYLCYIGDGYLYGVSDNDAARSPSYWAGLDEDMDIVQATLPAAIAQDLLSFTNSEASSSVGDGYEAADLAAKHMQNDTVIYSSEDNSDHYTGYQHDPLQESTEGKVARSYVIHDHGIDHAQYFRGHGLAHSDMEDTATGAGDTFEDALEDALDQLASDDWDLSQIESAIATEAASAGASSSAVEELKTQIRDEILAENPEFIDPETDDIYEDKADELEGMIEDVLQDTAGDLYYYVSVDVSTQPAGGGIRESTEGNNRWEVISLDVWGNAEEGFEVNDAHHTGRFVELPPEVAMGISEEEEQQLVDILIAAGELRRDVKAHQIEVEDLGENMIGINAAATSEPLFQLEREVARDASMDLPRYIPESAAGDTYVCTKEGKAMIHSGHTAKSLEVLPGDEFVVTGSREGGWLIGRLRSAGDFQHQAGFSGLRPEQLDSEILRASDFEIAVREDMIGKPSNYFAEWQLKAPLQEARQVMEIRMLAGGKFGIFDTSMRGAKPLAKANSWHEARMKINSMMRDAQKPLKD